MKRQLGPALFLFLLSAAPAFAGNAAPSYVELTDAPTVVVDWSRGNTQAVTLHANRAITFAHGQKGGHYMLIIKQDAHGSRTVKWPAGVRWPGGSPPTLTTLAGKTDYISFFYNGVNYDALGSTQNL